METPKYDIKTFEKDAYNAIVRNLKNNVKERRIYYKRIIFKTELSIILHPEWRLTATKSVFSDAIIFEVYINDSKIEWDSEKCKSIFLILETEHDRQVFEREKRIQERKDKKYRALLESLAKALN